MPSVRSLKKYLVEPVKNGRRVYGAIYELPSGKKVYLAHRKLETGRGRRANEIFCAGMKSASDAIRAGVAAWAIDYETLVLVRAKGVPFIGVLATDTGDMWVTALERYFDRSQAKFLNYESRGGSKQVHLPLTQFKRTFGTVKL